MKKNTYGEGNYEATQDYYHRTKKFIDAGRVDDAAKAAAPRTPAEAQEMKQAEEAALLRAKGGDAGAERAAPAPDGADLPARKPRTGTPAE
jgi:hypothetical protein